MTEHETVREQMALYLTGDLAPSEKERVERHVAGCADCRAHLAELEETLRMVRRAAPATDELQRRPRIAPWLARAAALLLAFLAGFAADRALSASPAPQTQARTEMEPEPPRERVYRALKESNARSELGRVLVALSALEKG